MPETLPLLQACSPRPREQTSESYAADLDRALHGEIGNAAAAADFFAGTHATPAMCRVANGIFDRLKHGSAANQPAIIRFNSMFGGGKTHTLIALAAAAKHPQLVRSGDTGGLIPACTGRACHSPTRKGGAKTPSSTSSPAPAKWRPPGTRRCAKPCGPPAAAG